MSVKLRFVVGVVLSLCLMSTHSRDAQAQLPMMVSPAPLNYSGEIIHQSSVPQNAVLHSQNLDPQSFHSGSAISIQPPDQGLSPHSNVPPIHGVFSVQSVRSVESVGESEGLSMTSATQLRPHVIYGQPAQGTVPLPVHSGASTTQTSLGFSQELEGFSDPVLTLPNRCRKDLDSYQPFPFDFSVTTTDGKKVTKKSFDGNVLIAVMWASWCAPCRKEIPHLVDLQLRYGDQGLKILGLANEGGADEATMMNTVRGVQQSDGINYDLALGNAAINQQVPDFGGYPTLVAIDSTGVVRLTKSGFVPLEELETYVALLLQDRRIAIAKQSSETFVDDPSADNVGTSMRLAN